MHAATSAFGKGSAPRDERPQEGAGREEALDEVWESREMSDSLHKREARALTEANEEAHRGAARDRDDLNFVRQSQDQARRVTLLH